MESIADFHKLYVPVLLGGGQAAARTARRLFFRYGVHSHLFSHRFSLRCRLPFWNECHRLPSTQQPSIVCMALLCFAEQLKEAEDGRTPLLLVCASPPSTLPWDEGIQHALEKVFIVRIVNPDTTLSPLP